MSFLFGGLQPIWSRVALDAVTISFLGLCISTEAGDFNTIALLIPVLMTWFTAGLTNRWTLSFPMVPLLMLQQSRRLSFVRRSSWASILIAVLSTILLLITTFLCVAFPPLQPPPVIGPYKVGIVDLHLPIAGHGSNSDNYNNNNNNNDRHVVARILYPTDNHHTGTMPYLKPNLASAFLKESVLNMAPPPINSLYWILDYWKLITIDSIQHAPPMMMARHERQDRYKNTTTKTHKFPLIAFSHGLGGSASVYSHVTRSMAANGHVVIAVDHTDGSHPMVVTKNGTVIPYDSSPIAELYSRGKVLEYVKVRRQQTEWRAGELIAAAETLRSLNERDIPELQELGISFIDCLDTDRLHVMGHSFGGSTALTVAFRRPDLVQSVVAHEPMADWTPNDVRWQLFPQAAIDSYDPPGHAVETGGRGEVQVPLPTTYDQMPSLFLFSGEFHAKNWGGTKFFQYMFQNGLLGRHGKHAVLHDMHHNEFSDMCFLTPIWLTRALKMTGRGNPIDNAAEAIRRTLEFLGAQASMPMESKKRVDREEKAEL